MSRRPLTSVLSFRLLLGGAFAAAALACSNISLSSDASGAPAAVAPPLNDLDATATGDGNAGGSLPPDASPATSDSGAPMLEGNALCNYGSSPDASHTCRPDDSFSCADPDAGAADAALVDAAPPLSACHVVHSSGATSQACSASGPGGDGAQCQTGTDCQPSFECVGSPGRCRHYCCNGDKSCNSPGPQAFCDVQAIASWDFDASTDAAAGPTYLVPVCMPVSKCGLLQPKQCPDGQTCALVKDDGSTSCVAIGPAKAGESCDVNHCEEGLTCLGSGPSGRICYQLCRVDPTQPNPCPAMQTCTSSSQIFTDPSYGLCQ
jgi:hypothetical protein